MKDFERSGNEKKPEIQDTVWCNTTETIYVFPTNCIDLPGKSNSSEKQGILPILNSYTNKERIKPASLSLADRLLCMEIVGMVI